jgi:hypothetical protein
MQELHAKLTATRRKPWYGEPGTIGDEAGCRTRFVTL